VLKSGEIVTPSLKRGTILPGVTRDSVLTLAREYADELQPFMAISAGDESDGDIKVTVSERDVKVKDLLDATEVFITGTAAEVVPVQSIATSPRPKDELGEREDDSFSVKFPHGESLPGGPVTTKLLNMLREVMAEKRTCEATKDWLCDVYETPEGFQKGGTQ
jgi:branched-chain amino acid aminotransferase